MPRKRTPPDPNRIKAGCSATTAEARRKLFIEHYLTNGNNGSQAAAAAGFSAASAPRQSDRYMHDPVVAAALAARAKEVAELAEMTTENWAREVRALAFSRPGALFDGEGQLIPVHMLPDHVQAAIASVEQLKDGTKVRFVDKVAALQMMGKHLGLFEKDNAQLRENVRIVVELVG